MGKASKPKQPRGHGAMRQVLSSNVQRLLDSHYKDIKTATARVKALAKNSKVGHGTIQRILAAGSGSSLDTIERLSLALEVSVYQILLPNLDVDNPQVVKGATVEEQRLYADFKKAALGLPTPKQKQPAPEKPSKAGTESNVTTLRPRKKPARIDEEK